LTVIDITVGYYVQGTESEMSLTGD